jgi:hypothetical protein
MLQKKEFRHHSSPITFDSFQSPPPRARILGTFADMEIAAELY